MKVSDRIETTARSLNRQRLSLAPIDIDQGLRPRNEAEAYAMQLEGNRLLAASGLGSPVGHKIGCTTPVMQAFLGIPNPCAGELFGATRVESGASISRARFRRLGVECEVVVTVSRDVLPADAPFTRSNVAPCVGSVHAGIEIVDDRYRDYRELGALTLIADNFFNAAYVLGAPVYNWQELDLAALSGRMLVNGEEVGRGNSGMILDHPFEALAWLANSRAERGLELRKGTIVFLGSIVETKWLEPGDSVRIEVDSLGALDLAVSA